MSCKNNLFTKKQNKNPAGRGTKERPFSISGKKYGCDIDKLYRKELSKQNDFI